MLREGNNKGGRNMINHVVLMKFKPDVNDDAIDDLEKSKEKKWLTYYPDCGAVTAVPSEM